MGAHKAFHFQFGKQGLLEFNILPLLFPQPSIFPLVLAHAATLHARQKQARRPPRLHVRACKLHTLHTSLVTKDIDLLFSRCCPELISASHTHDIIILMHVSIPFQTHSYAMPTRSLYREVDWCALIVRGLRGCPPASFCRDLCAFPTNCNSTR